MSQATRLQFLPPWSWRAWVGLAIAVVLVIGFAIFPWPTPGPLKAAGFEEVRLSRGDMPVAIATARDGTVWFTLESSAAIGRLRNGRVERIPKGAESIEPLGLAVGSDGSAWYTDAPKQRIARASPDGAIAFFGLATPIAQLGRLAIAPDGAVWFAETTVASVTRLHDGRFTRHVVATLAPRIPPDAWPFGIAVAPDGAVWATLPSANKLLRIAPDGTGTAFDVPTRQSGLGDVAVAPDGTVYFLEITANKIGRIVGERLEEFAVPMASAGLTALAVAPDGAAWFTELRGHRLGRLHAGRIAEFALPRPDARPIGITVDAGNNVWYADLSGWLGRLDAGRARVR
jgi:virginiamycin B lyase